MTHDPYTITPTTPQREVENVRHRIARVQDALLEGRGDKEANQRELQLLWHLEHRWEAQRQDLHRQRVEHHTRMRRVHQQLAARHIAELMRLQREEVCIGDALSTNGKH